MTNLMEEVIQKARLLSDDQQDALARIILQEMESELTWNELFARPESAGLLASMADEALAQAMAGLARPLERVDR